MQYIIVIIALNAIHYVDYCTKCNTLHRLLHIERVLLQNVYNLPHKNKQNVQKGGVLPLRSKKQSTICEQAVLRTRDVWLAIRRFDG